MPYRVVRNPDLCKKNFDRPGCCWYLCDDRDEKICGKCFSCYNNCPHGVYEIIQGDPYPLNQEKCVGCRICLEMCPSRAIEVNAIPEDAREAWGFPDIVEITRKSQSASYKIRSTGALRKIPDFDDLVVIPAQVSRPPLDKYREPCGTDVVLGDRYAENPLKLKTPVMITCRNCYKHWGRRNAS